MVIISWSRDEGVVRALVSHQCGLGSNRHKWVEFVVGSHFAPRVFLCVLLFSSLHKKPTLLNSNNFDLETVDEEPLHGMCHCKYLFHFTYHLILIISWCE